MSRRGLISPTKHFLPEFVDELLGRADIVELISRYLSLQKRGREHLGLCPFHSEKTPSFSVSSHKQIFYCFGCGVGGNALRFLMLYLKMSFIEAVEELANRYGVRLPENLGSKHQTNRDTTKYREQLQSLMNAVAGFYQKQLTISEKAKNYLKNRGFGKDICHLFALGYAPEGRHLWQHYSKFGSQTLIRSGLMQSNYGKLEERFQDRILFPIRDRQGHVLAFGGRVLKAGHHPAKYLNSPETPLFRKKETLYGLWEITQHQQVGPLVVVEGYTDAVSLSNYGLTHVVATLGTAVSLSHVRKLLHASQELIFCFDGDEAGQTAVVRTLVNILPLMTDEVKIQVISLPHEHDPASFIHAYGVKKFYKLIEESIGATNYLFSQFALEADKRYPQRGSEDARKAYFGTLLHKILQRLPNGLLKDLLLKRLAKKIGVDTQNIQNIHASFRKKSPLTNIHGHYSYNLADRCIYLLLHDPHLFDGRLTLDLLGKLKLEHGELLSQVLQAANTLAKPTMAKVLERLESPADQRRILEVVQTQANIPQIKTKNPYDPQKEFDQIVQLLQNRIEQQEIVLEIDTLLAKDTLSNEQKIRFNELILAQHKAVIVK